MTNTIEETVRESIRTALDRSGRSMRSVASEAEVEAALISRHLRGGGLTLGSLDKLAPVLGLRVDVKVGRRR